MLSDLGGTQQELLRNLLRNRAGLTVDELSGSLKISRTAVNQHVMSLEREGYVDRGELQRTGGRPCRAVQLSSKGVDLFPKQYSWFSGLLLGAMKKENGSAGATQLLQQLAGTVAKGLRSRIDGKQGDARMLEIIKIMNELSYDARLARGKIEANNCVYHGLALEHPEVCEFDLELLRSLSGERINHEECIVKGGNVCRFAVSARAIGRP